MLWSVSGSVTSASQDHPRAEDLGVLQGVRAVLHLGLEDGDAVLELRGGGGEQRLLQLLDLREGNLCRSVC